jgi:hypothetical protein
MRHQLKVLLVHTASVEADVIELFLSRDEAMSVDPHDDVDCNGLAIQVHAGIASTPTVP